MTAMRTQADREVDWSTGRELERKDAEIERLRAALKPFAEVPPHSPPSRRCIVVDASSGPYHFLQSDLDRAKALYKEPLVKMTDDAKREND